MDPDYMDTGPDQVHGAGTRVEFNADTPMADNFTDSDPALNYPSIQADMDLAASDMHDMEAQQALASCKSLELQMDHDQRDGQESSSFGNNQHTLFGNHHQSLFGDHQSIFGRSTAPYSHVPGHVRALPQTDSDSNVMDEHRRDAMSSSALLPYMSLFGDGGAAAQNDPNIDSTRDEPELDIDAQVLEVAEGDEDEENEGRRSPSLYAEFRSHEDHFYGSDLDDDDELPAHLAPGGMVAMLQDPNGLTYCGEKAGEDEADCDHVQDDAHEEQPEDNPDGDYVEDGPQEEQSGDEDEEEEEEVQVSPIKYELRESARKKRQVMSSVQDWDESGNYDPSEERKALLRRGPAPKTPRTPKRPQEGFEESPGKKVRTIRQLSPTKARQVGAKWVVILKLKSDAGKELLKKCPGNWPYGEEYNCFNDIPIVSIDEDDGFESPTKRLRPRKRLVRYDTPFAEESLPPLPDPAGEHDDLRGHPAARGCVRCRQMKVVCDLRKPGGVWPCVQCVTHFKNAKYIPCEMITPPERKQRCEQCHDHGIDCSYAAEEGEEVLDDHSAPCRQCAASKEKCVAGPHPDAKVPRATYTPPPGVKYNKARPFVSCAPCRRERKHCSLRKKEDEPPCKSCLESDTECTFERVVPSSKTLDMNAPVADETFLPTSKSLEKNAPVAKTVSDQQPVAKLMTIANDSAVEIDENSKTSKPEESNFVATGPLADYYSQLFKDECVAGPSDWKGKGRAKSRGNVSQPDPAVILQPEPKVIDLDAWQPKKSPKYQANGRSSGVVSGPESYYEQYDTREPPKMEARAKPKSKYNSVNIINPQSTVKVEKKKYVASEVPIAEKRNEPDMEIEDCEGNKGFLGKLFTPYAHPIVFNSYHKSAKGCKWCEDPSYALFGIGWVKPNVIAWADKCGYTEIDEGHRSEGIEAGKMCVGCVEKRMEIMTCEAIASHKHQNFRSLWPLTMDKMKKDEACAVQIERLYNGKPSADDKWCSICPGVASFECCRPHGGGSGCDLRFCDLCYDESSSYRGGLKELLEHKLHTEKLMTEARADASFLLEDGILAMSIFKEGSE